MHVLAKGGRFEQRSMSPGLTSSWNSALDLTGAIPPHGFSTLNQAGVMVTEKTVEQISTVNSCIDILTNNMLTLGDPRAFRTAYDKANAPYPAFIAPTPAVLSNTWGSDPQSLGTMRTVYSLAMFCEAWWHVVTRDFYGFPSALQVLHPSFLNSETKNGVTTYSYGLGGATVEVAAGDLIHIQRRATPGALRAVSGIHSGGLVFALALAASQYGLSWFGQGAAPGLMLTTDQKLSPDEQQRIMETVIVQHSGLANAHLPMLFTGGVKPQVIGSTPDQAQYLGTLGWARDEVASFFGVPGEWVGSTSGKPGALGKTMAEQNQWFTQQTLAGYYIPLAEAYSSLLPRGQSAWLNLRKLQRGNTADVAKEVVALRTGGVMSKNEIRQDLYSLPPSTDPDADLLEAPLNSNTSPTPADDPADPTGAEAE